MTPHPHAKTQCMYCKRDVIFSVEEEYYQALDDGYCMICWSCNNRSISTISSPVTDIVKFNRYILELSNNPHMMYYAADMTQISKAYLEHVANKSLKNKRQQQQQKKRNRVN